MRWNRLITSVSIFLLSLTKIAVGILGTLLIVATLANRFEVPFGFHLGDDYQLENREIQSLTVNFNGVNYENIAAKADDYYIDLAEVPVSKYWTIVPLLLMFVALYFFLELIIKLLKSIEEREFFSLANVKRLRLIGGMLIGFSILSWVYSLVKNLFLMNMIQVEGVERLGSRLSLPLGFFGSSLFIGLMILLIANAFEHGLKLEKEQELTI